MGREKWHYLTLSNSSFEIIDGDRGINYPHGDDFSKLGDCLFLNAKNVTIDGFRFDQRQYITFEKDRLLNKGKLKRGDIILTTRGTVGNVAFYSRNIPFDHMRINSGMIILRCDQRTVDSQFMYWLFRSSVIQEQITSLSTGSAQPQLPVNIMKNIGFLLPSIAEQRNIAATLACLDDKIELNNRIIANLEAQAQAIFKSWFVDFEPFLDGEFEETELGLIPKGWRVGVLSDIAKITMGQSPSGESFNENEIGTVFYQGRAEFGFRFPTRRLHTTAPTRMAQSGDVLLSVRAPVGDINVATEECCIGRGLSAVHSINGCQSYLIYLIKQLRDVLDQFNGEGTVFGSINRKDLNQLAVIISPIESMQRFEEVVGRFDAEILSLHMENTLLITARDTLLPKLMSGEIEVPVEG